MTARVLVCVSVLFAMFSDTRDARGNPATWAARCRVQFAKASRALGKLGPVRVTASTASPKRGFGEVTLVIEARGGRMTASAGPDRSGKRYRRVRGIESKRYEEWHSPYWDSMNGDPPATSVRSLHEELHHRIAVGVLGGEIIVEGSTRPEGAKFAETMKPVIGACVADVTPDEADPSLAWTTACLQGLATAHASLAKIDPFFQAATCTRKPFGASCGRVTEGGEPHWNALTTFGGDTLPTGWAVAGVNRLGYGQDAMVWAGNTMTPTQYKTLTDAFRAPLERCSRRMRAAMQPAKP